VDESVSWEREIPTVVLLIDRSGSMLIPLGAQGTRWGVVRDTLLDPNSGVIAKLEGDVRFGLDLFTSLNGQQGGTCPTLEEVKPALHSYSAIKKVYEPATPLDDTPTGESIYAVTAQLVPMQEPGRKLIVLATDGNPDTCEDPKHQTPAAQAGAVKAAQEAFSQGVETFIISVASGVALDHLKDMANAGAGLPVGGATQAPYYEANDSKALSDAFNAIINGVRSCVLKINGQVDSSQAPLGKVTLDGTSLGYLDANGWKLNSPSEVELTGASCNAIQQGDHAVNVVFPCGVVRPPK
jgi:hypothetical protein